MKWRFRAFLDGAIAFTAIASVNERVLHALGDGPAPADLGAVRALDAESRAFARACLSKANPA